MDISLLGQWFDVRYILACGVALLAVVGLIAVVSPRHFAALSRSSSKWVDTNRLSEVLDRRYDIDHLIVRNSRVFGLAVIGAAVLLGYFLCIRMF